MAPEPRLEPVPGWRFGEPQQPSVREKVRLGIFHALRRAGVRLTVQARWHFGTVVDVTVPSDFGRCLWVAGCFEPNETAFLASVLRPGMTFIDVGANIGLYTLLAAHLVAAEGTLVAVEPSPARTGVPTSQSRHQQAVICTSAHRGAWTERTALQLFMSPTLPTPARTPLVSPYTV